MREKYESLKLSVLRELAKSRGLKRISGLKKADLIDRMLQADEEEAAKKGKKQEKQPPETELEETADSRQTEARKQEEHRRRSGKRPEERKTEDTEKTEDRHAEEKKPREKTAEKESSRRSPESRKSRSHTGGTRKKNHTGQENDSPEQEEQHAHHRKKKYERTEQTHEQDSHARKNGHTAEPEKGSPHSIKESDLDTGEAASGILEVMADGYGFIRSDNYLPGEDDVYVSPSLIRRFNLKTGDIITGHKRLKSQGEKFSALLFISDVNGVPPYVASKREHFENLTPVFPDERIRLETDRGNIATRMIDLVAPVGKGQRGMIVSPPKAGKTTLLKEIASAVKTNNPEMHLIILLIDERPEEVTDIKEAIEGDQVEVIYSTFDELPEHHKRVSEMVIERAKRLVEHHQDVMILLDSITRLARAYNLVVPPSGRTLSGGLDPAALHMPKRFFGAARNMREGGSLTILATALVDTGSKMDDMVYEEFKGTGNMELILDRRLSERRIFPAIDIVRSGTRREDLLLTGEEQEAVKLMRHNLNGMKTEEATETVRNALRDTESNRVFVHDVLTRKRLYMKKERY